MEHWPKQRDRAVTDVACEGEYVVLFASRTDMFPVLLKHGESVHNRYGKFQHSDIIGLRYGSSINGIRQLRKNRKVVSTLVLLPMTQHLWINSVPHRTQVLYSADISMIIEQLETVKPGSIVFESGTGSGSLSYNFARTVAPDGRLFTFEFNPFRAKAAREEFSRLGLSDVITVTRRDIVGLGFVDSLIEREADEHVVIPKPRDSTDCDGDGNERFEFQAGGVDAIFLDLPSPAKVIANPTTSALLRECGHLCSFSPCIEQTQAVCLELVRRGFVEVKTWEILAKDYLIRPTERPAMDMQSSHGLRKARYCETFHQELDKRRKMGQLDTTDDSLMIEDCVASSSDSKMGSVSSSNESGTVSSSSIKAVIKETAAVAAVSSRDLSSIRSMIHDPDWDATKKRDSCNESVTRMTARPIRTSFGHTGYLTFARKSQGISSNQPG